MKLTDKETNMLISAMRSVVYTSEADRRMSIRVERKLHRWLDAPDCIFETKGELRLPAIYKGNMI